MGESSRSRFSAAASPSSRQTVGEKGGRVTTKINLSLYGQNTERQRGERVV